MNFVGVLKKVLRHTSEQFYQTTEINEQRSENLVKQLSPFFKISMAFKTF
jgi:hypothetical protein